MIITDIQIQKNNKQKVSIFIDNEYSFSLCLETYSLSKLTKNTIITKKEIEELKKRDIYQICNLHFIHIISYKNYLSFEIKRKLKQKLRNYYKEEFTDDILEIVINKTIETAVKNKLLDDENYIKDYIQIKIKTGWGKNKIIQKLVLKGVPYEIVNNYFTNDNIELTNKCYELALKKWNSLITNKNKNDNNIHKTKQKVTQYLLNKGYSYSEIKDIIEDISKK